MSAVSTPKIFVFHNPPQIPSPITVKMIEKDQPLPASESRKQPFIVGQGEINAVRIKEALDYAGPFVAEAKLGPKFHTEAPTRFKKLPSQNYAPRAYGWKPGNRQDPHEELYQNIIVCGVETLTNKKTNKTQEYVYYTLAGANTNLVQGMRLYRKTADTVYVAAMQTFSEHLRVMYPPAMKVDYANCVRSLENRLERVQGFPSDDLDGWLALHPQVLNEKREAWKKIIQKELSKIDQMTGLDRANSIMAFRKEFPTVKPAMTEKEHQLLGYLQFRMSFLSEPELKAHLDYYRCRNDSMRVNEVMIDVIRGALQAKGGEVRLPETRVERVTLREYWSSYLQS